MERIVNIADVVISLRFDRMNPEETEMKCFYTAKKPDIVIDFSSVSTIPPTDGEYMGSDVHYKYYNSDENIICDSRLGGDRIFCRFVYSRSSEYMSCVFIEDIDPVIWTDMFLFRLIPMKLLLNPFDAVLNHSSQVSLSGKSIIFTGNSGIGKTTQAFLWNRYEKGAVIVNGDRTVIRGEKRMIRSYGYPVDGSSCIINPMRSKLSAIVLMARGEEDTIESVRTTEAFKLLLNQCAVAYWDNEIITRSTELIGRLITEVPVYRLYATPTERAVWALKERLTREGVL